MHVRDDRVVVEDPDANTADTRVVREDADKLGGRGMSLCIHCSAEVALPCKLGHAKPWPLKGVPCHAMATSCCHAQPTTVLNGTARWPLADRRTVRAAEGGCKQLRQLGQADGDRGRL